jgi:hypothetical protein
MTNRKQMGERVLKLEGGPKDDGRIARDAAAFNKKMQELVARLDEHDRGMSLEDYETKLSVAQRIAWKVRFVGADMEHEAMEYLERRKTDPDAGLLKWRFENYTGLDE